jgi:hypothetical protein
MSQYNGNFKTISLTDNTVGDTVSLTLTSSAAADDMAISVDSGVGNAGVSGAGPFTMPVQSMVVYAKGWRLILEYNTPNPSGVNSVVTMTA